MTNLHKTFYITQHYRTKKRNKIPFYRIQVPFYSELEPLLVCISNSAFLFTHFVVQGCKFGITFE